MMMSEVQSLFYKELYKDTARNNLLYFIKYTWMLGKDRPFIIGMHTIEMCKIIDKAFEDYKNGESSFLVINCPFRHGKSQISSRHAPAKFLGMFPTSEIILTSYSDDLSQGFSANIKEIIRSEKYQELYPNTKLSIYKTSTKEWNLDNNIGKLKATGIGGQITGGGYHLGVLDDYLKGREEAESPRIRDKRWSEFTETFLTRRAPVSITLIVSTRWHEDDITGRIKIKMKNDPDFPRFEFINFPAFSDEYKDGILFPKRFSKKWYIGHRASLGTYASACILQGDPTPRGGNMLKTTDVKIHNGLDEFPKNIRYIRVWDLAHTKKEREKDDPDYTSGTLLGLEYQITENGKIPHLWIKDVSRCQEGATLRDAKMKSISEIDGDTVGIVMENSIDSKDAYEYAKGIFTGIRAIHPVTPRRDKVVRATPLEPLFEAGHVHIVRAEWNYDWINEIRAFPNGKHDDQVDNLSCGYEYLRNKLGAISGEMVEQDNDISFYMSNRRSLI